MRNVTGGAALAALLLAGCNTPNPGPTAYHPPYVAATAQPANASVLGQPGAPPAFDKNGLANYDSQGNYVGAHGVGTLVDNPDVPQPKLDPVHQDVKNIDDAMCKSIKAGDPNASC
jgi:hypothetical protein